MTTLSVPHAPETGALSNLIDFTAERAKRRPEDRTAQQVWSTLKVAAPSTEGSMARRGRVTSLAGVPDEYVLTPSDVAAILASSIDKIGEMFATGRIPNVFRVGRGMRIHARDLRAYIVPSRKQGSKQQGSDSAA